MNRDRVFACKPDHMMEMGRLRRSFEGKQKSEVRGRKPYEHTGDLKSGCPDKTRAWGYPDRCFSGKYNTRLYYFTTNFKIFSSKTSLFSGFGI